MPLALCAASLSAPTDARADDAAELAGLLSENVVSGASKSAELASDAPATVSVLSAEDMRRYGIRSVAEAVDFLGMGVITQDPLHSVEIGSRGVLLTSDYGSHFLVVVDGHALNEQWAGTAYYEQGLALPLELIDHIELILGPGSVLYGGNAMLGVINIVTKEARSAAGLTVVAEGGLAPQQGIGGRLESFAPGDLGTTYRLGLGVGKSFRVGGEDASFVAHAELYNQNGPSFAFPLQSGNVNPDGTPTDFGPRAPALGAWGGRVHDQYYTSVPTVWAKLKLGNLTLEARASRYRRATPYINYFNQLASDFDEPRSAETERFLSLDIRYQRHLGSLVNLVGHAYADDYKYTSTAYVSDTSLCMADGACLTTAMSKARWAGAELQASVDWLKNESLTTLLGTEARVRRIGGGQDSELASDGQPIYSAPLGTVTEVPWAFFVQQRYSPIGRLHLNAGARLDSDPRGGDHISPRAAFAADAWKNGVVKGIYSEAFRAPTYFESIYRLNDSSGQTNQLDPEVVRGIEATVEQRFGAQRFLLGGYRTWWHDMISLTLLDPATGALGYQNASKIDNYGLNALFEGSFGRWKYGASLTWAYTRRLIDGQALRLPVAPRVFGNARVSYDFGGDWPTLALASSFVGSRLADRANDGNFPVTPRAPSSLTLRGTVSGDVPKVPSLSYRLSVNYVTGAVSPYVAGPNQVQDPTVFPRPNAELVPVNRLSTFATLIYNLAL
jgi:outer membrane receptor for ferrienterochelin and colicins